MKFVYLDTLEGLDGIIILRKNISRLPTNFLQIGSSQQILQHFEAEVKFRTNEAIKLYNQVG